jgi:hypothetical protein
MSCLPHRTAVPAPNSVFSPFNAAKATFALNAAVWFRRGRLLIRSPLFGHLRPKTTRTSTYQTVQFPEPPLASSLSNKRQYEVL